MHASTRCGFEPWEVGGGEFGELSRVRDSIVGTTLDMVITAARWKDPE